MSTEQSLYPKTKSCGCVKFVGGRKRRRTRKKRRKSHKKRKTHHRHKSHKRHRTRHRHKRRRTHPYRIFMKGTTQSVRYYTSFLL